MPRDDTGYALIDAPAPLRPAAESNDVTHEPADALHLLELTAIVRERLGLGSEITDGTILSGLEAIVAQSSPRERWRAAFNSTLGHWLALHGVDLNSALNALIVLLPKPRM